MIREKPEHAQKFLFHLSKVFRYSLSNKNQEIVEFEQELALLRSNIALFKMRFEHALIVNIRVDETNDLKIPHMALQPLLENAIKHNMVSEKEPLYIDIYQEENTLVFQNTINLKKYNEPSTGIGLHNLNERYQILNGEGISIKKSDRLFCVKLPLLYAV